MYVKAEEYNTSGKQVCDLTSHIILEYFSFFLLMFFVGREAVILLQRGKNFE